MSIAGAPICGAPICSEGVSFVGKSESTSWMVQHLLEIDKATLWSVFTDACFEEFVLGEPSCFVVEVGKNCVNGAFLPRVTVCEILRRPKKAKEQGIIKGL